LQYRENSACGGLFLESVGVSENEKQGILKLAADREVNVDPVVSFLVGATNGIGYKKIIGRMQAYPIPHLPLPAGKGRLLLDIGCSWGRWCFAAARKGFRPVGIDFSLGAVMAGRRVARSLGCKVEFVVGDARYLPFKDSIFQCAFSYSVFQHFSREDAQRSFAEAGRVLSPGGQSLIQMPNKFGIRCLYHQARRNFREGKGFEVRYWSPLALWKLAESTLGATKMEVDCFFGLGLKYEDRHLMAPLPRYAATVSEYLRRASRVARPLLFVADSLYLASTKEESVATAAAEEGASLRKRHQGERSANGHSGNQRLSRRFCCVHCD
jgi:SAM-dependent methyltransferase